MASAQPTQSGVRTGETGTKQLSIGPARQVATMAIVPRALDDLIALLDLEPIEVNIFRGLSPDDDRQRVFGGQVAGQALVARPAARSTGGRWAARAVHPEPGGGGRRP